MKQWKIDIAQAIASEYESARTCYLPGIGETDRAVKFSDVAKNIGYNHISRSDIMDIVNQAKKINPSLRAVNVADTGENVPLFTSLYFTDL